MDRIAQLEQFLAQQPNDSFLQHALALERIKRGELDIARSLFESLLAREPGYVGSYYHLAKLYDQLGELSLSEKTYQTGIAEARKAGDRHAQNELQMALEELLDR
jgi:Tfp pilus assembly protein PilF